MIILVDQLKYSYFSHLWMCLGRCLNCLGVSFGRPGEPEAFTVPSVILKNGAENLRPQARNDFKHSSNMQKSMSGRRTFYENIEKRRRFARGAFKMFIFSQNGHKDQNGHILEGPETPKYTEILENPRRRFVFAHGGRRFTTFEAFIRLL